MAGRDGQGVTGSLNGHQAYPLLPFGCVGMQNQKKAEIVDWLRMNAQAQTVEKRGLVIKISLRTVE